MKLFVLFISLLFSNPEREVVVYRTLLHQAVNNTELAQLFYQKTKIISNGNLPVLRGYKAMASIMMCKHTYNPFSKLSYFNKGKKELDAAIKCEPGNMELHFLRFVTQCNCPSFLGYNANIEADKKLLLTFLDTESSYADKDLRGKIVKFMLMCKQASDTEKKSIKT